MAKKVWMRVYEYDQWELDLAAGNRSRFRGASVPFWVSGSIMRGDKPGLGPMDTKCWGSLGSWVLQHRAHNSSWSCDA